MKYTNIITWFFGIFLVYYSRENNMGIVRAEITLKNAIDMGNARRGMIKDSEIRQTTVTAVVDTGAGTLVINEAIREKLGLEITGKCRATLADGAAHDYEVTEPVSVHSFFPFHCYLLFAICYLLIPRFAVHRDIIKKRKQ